eukprot:TRINITY_DN9483_c0_g2_i1.p1 TRINITY_DN9483_c0_g2~~TRINITY_DN9483_c0_g2_i1.p1  ORF type:complete len:588 (-),score=50.88 TRINITY_DN9483_c0_g2_i1:389-2152(-)
MSVQITLVCIFLYVANTCVATEQYSSHGQWNQNHDSQDPNRPHFHVMPPSGWLNDPNGLIYYQGMYHTFFQYNPYYPSWDWDIYWGHAATPDLVHWTVLPPAISPSAGGPDCNGSWSGGMTLSNEGVPTAVYTGVILKGSGCQVTEENQKWDYSDNYWIETVMWAQPSLQSNDLLLIDFPEKGVLIGGPPLGMKLTGWRDPFVYQRAGKQGTDGDYIILLGSGLTNQDSTEYYGGAIMVYTSPTIGNGSHWTYQGLAMEGTPDDAIMWECPWLVEITSDIGESEYTHVLGVGGALWNYTHPDQYKNPLLYWLGHFDEPTFKFTPASEAKRLDIGELLYASNRLIDETGRVLIWGWLRECRFPFLDDVCEQQNYAGSLSIPRVLKIEGEFLKLEVPQEMSELRKQLLWSTTNMQIDSKRFYNTLTGQVYHYELLMTLKKGSSEIVGVLFSRAYMSALIVVRWQDRQIIAIKGSQEVLRDLNASDIALDNEVLDVYGGVLENLSDQEDTFTVRIFVDGSAMEVFTSTGQVMSLRVYFGMQRGIKEQVDLVSYEGQSLLLEGNVWTMASYWEHDQHSRIVQKLQQQYAAF